jgi:hypothetical protein
LKYYNTYPHAQIFGVIILINNDEIHLTWIKTEGKN